MSARLWLRMGDAADYEEYPDDLDAVALALRECNARPPLARVGTYGLAGGAFPRHDPISLFWGGDAADPFAPLSDDQLAGLNAALAECYREYPPTLAF